MHSMIGTLQARKRMMSGNDMRRREAVPISQPWTVSTHGTYSTSTNDIWILQISDYFFCPLANPATWNWVT